MIKVRILGDNDEFMLTCILPNIPVRPFCIDIYDKLKFRRIEKAEIFGKINVDQIAGDRLHAAVKEKCSPSTVLAANSMQALISSSSKNG